jgi:hypothetical protein
MYRFPGFRPYSTVHAIFGDPTAGVIGLLRRGKKLPVASKELDKQYMREQLRRVGTSAPGVLGIDEIAIRLEKSRNFDASTTVMPA